MDMQCSLAIEYAKGDEDRQGKDVLCHFINHTFILSIYGYYPNVEYRRFINLVVR
nr:hypothetical protein [uncultured Oribacterium sp.]